MTARYIQEALVVVLLSLLILTILLFTKFGDALTAQKYNRMNNSSKT